MVPTIELTFRIVLKQPTIMPRIKEYTLLTYYIIYNFQTYFVDLPYYSQLTDTLLTYHNVYN